MTMPQQIIVATGNAGKYREIAHLLEGAGIEPLWGKDFDLPEPEETGITFEQNAIIKAEAACASTNRAVLADDSGFCVTSLDDAPGVRSARLAIQPDGSVDFNAAMRSVAQALQHKGMEANGAAAWFGCALSLATPGHATRTWFGRCDGWIVWPKRGELGFGYDAMFAPAIRGESGELVMSARTFGEMPSQEKHGIGGNAKGGLSHRARAFFAMLCQLEADKRVASSG